MAALAVCVLGLATVAAAQAPVSATDLSADVLLAVLGQGSAFEIELPDEVHAVHVVAVRGDEVVVDHSLEVAARSDAGAHVVVVSVGAVGPTLRCPLVVFTHMRLERDGRRSGETMSGTCVEVEEPVGLVPRGGFLATSFELGRWYPVEGVYLRGLGPGAQRPTLDQPRLDEVIFHVFLATDHAPPPIEEITVPPR